MLFGATEGPQVIPRGLRTHDSGLFFLVADEERGLVDGEFKGAQRGERRGLGGSGVQSPHACQHGLFVCTHRTAEGVCPDTDPTNVALETNMAPEYYGPIPTSLSP